MFILEIIDSSDQEIIGKRTFYKNQIYIGFNSIDLHIPEKISSQAFSLEVSESGILLNDIERIPFMLNSKRAESSRKINFNDIFQIGSTQIQIIQSSYEVYKSKMAVMQERYEQLVKEDSKLLDIIKLIQEQVE